MNRRLPLDVKHVSCHNRGMTTTKRFQVTEIANGYAVKDTRDGSVWTKTYTSVGRAANKAIQLNEAHGGRRY